MPQPVKFWAAYLQKLVWTSTPINGRENFPVSITSAKAWLFVLTRAGRTRESKIERPSVSRHSSRIAKRGQGAASAKFLHKSCGIRVARFGSSFVPTKNLIAIFYPAADSEFPKAAPM